MPDTSTLISQFYVKLDGADATDELVTALLDITIETSLHLPDVATITLHDPHLHWVDDPSLAPGKTLQVSVHAGSSERDVFDGEIVELEPHFESSTQRLTMRAFDRLHRLARGQRVRSFQNVSDGDLVRKLAQEAGLRAQVGPTSQVYPYVFQNNETNLAFLQKRAAALGYLLYVKGSELHCEAPGGSGHAVELEWGVSLREFSPRLTTVQQSAGITVRGWDPASRQEIVGQAQRGQGGPHVGQTSSGGELAQSAFSLDAQTLIADRPIRTQAQADRLAQAVADQQAGRFIEADGLASGDPAIVAGASVHVTAVGDTFSGSYFITSATHVYSATAGYTTRFTVSGLSPSSLLGVLNPAGVTASAPRQFGLVVGIVTDNNDPNGQGRVKVKYPWLSSEHASDWARVAVVGGGAQRGIEFLPEVNDEVLVGFEMGDIQFPYVLGGLWNGQDKPPKANSAAVSGGKVQQRVIATRAGHLITLDDTDGGGGITIQDKNGNTIVLDSGANKLTMTIKGDATLTANGNIDLEAQGNLTLKAQGQLQIQGMSVSMQGSADVSLKGTPINLN